jgi:hypothetical protein
MRYLPPLSRGVRNQRRIEHHTERYGVPPPVSVGVRSKKKIMKCILPAATIGILLSTVVLRADSPPSITEFVFSRTAPDGQSYCSQTLAYNPRVPVELQQDTPMRFQVFRASDAHLLWEAKRPWGFGTASEVYLCDAKHVAVLHKWIPTDGDTVILLQLITNSTTRAELKGKLAKAMNRNPVLEFYRKDELVSSVSFSDLKIPLELPFYTVSHAVLHTETSSSVPRYPCTGPLLDDVITNQTTRPMPQDVNEPTWFDDGDNTTSNTFSVVFCDGIRRTYDFTSGELLATNAVTGYSFSLGFWDAPASYSSSGGITPLKSDKGADSEQSPAGDSLKAAPEE